jgi:hypothetical protein
MDSYLDSLVFCFLVYCYLNQYLYIMLNKSIFINNLAKKIK